MSSGHIYRLHSVQGAGALQSIQLIAGVRTCVQCDQWLTFLLQIVYLPAQHGSDTSKYGHTDNVQCSETAHHTCEDLLRD